MAVIDITIKYPDGYVRYHFSEGKSSWEQVGGSIDNVRKRQIKTSLNHNITQTTELRAALIGSFKGVILKSGLFNAVKWIFIQSDMHL